MDLATLIGIISGIICTAYPIFDGGYPKTFLNIPSLMLVVGGGIASTLISYRIKEVTRIFQVVGSAFSRKEVDLESTIRLLVELSQKARREGLLALESEQDNIEDSFIRRSVQLIVDGVEPEMIKESLDLELDNMALRHERGQSLFRTMAVLFPAWGMIGTLIGLINLLKALDKPENIGPAMALALVTTLYGSLLAHFICNPIANKLSLKSKEEIQQKEMIIEGILSIQAGENPRIMEHKLKTFLSSEQRELYEAKNEDLFQQKDNKSNSSSRIVTE
ncbi:MAG TPA: motility protein A [Clostridiales bacterium]|mgnify:CR=1 FL=1|nr:motility protein A [Clostridiales bacterium]